jgi:methylase of polypeptide subunit release factors
MLIIFVCEEESFFYSHCLEMLLFNNCNCCDISTVNEFGSGDGNPVIQAIKNSGFNGVVQGFEINKAACNIAKNLIANTYMSGHYNVINGCFFKNHLNYQKECLVSNPPYLPSPDDDLFLPSLYGGEDGTLIVKKLLTLNYENVLLLISSYSNPLGVLEYSVKQNYVITNFIITPMPYGRYSRQKKVWKTIQELKKHNKAFCSNQIYLLAGVLFTKKNGKQQGDLTTEFGKAICCLQDTMHPI